MEKDNFITLYEAFEDQSLEAQIERMCSSEDELHDVILALIEHRSLMRDVELEKLDAESAALLKKLKDVQLAQVLESLSCFKETLALHKHLINQDDERGDGGKAQETRGD